MVKNKENRVRKLTYGISPDTDERAVVAVYDQCSSYSKKFATTHYNSLRTTQKVIVQGGKGGKAGYNQG